MPPKRKAPKASAVAAAKRPTLEVDERPQMSPAAIIEELQRIQMLGWEDRDAARARRPEWFEFKTNMGRTSREVRKKAHALLTTVPGLTKKRLCEAAGRVAPAGMNKFLENKGECSDNCGVSGSAEQGLNNLLDVLEQQAESAQQRRKRLSELLKLGLGLSNLGERVKWSDEQLARFHAAFPGIELPPQGTKK